MALHEGTTSIELKNDLGIETGLYFSCDEFLFIHEIINQDIGINISQFIRVFEGLSKNLL